MDLGPTDKVVAMPSGCKVKEPGIALAYAAEGMNVVVSVRPQSAVEAAARSFSAVLAPNARANSSETVGDRIHLNRMGKRLPTTGPKGHGMPDQVAYMTGFKELNLTFAV